MYYRIRQTKTESSLSEVARLQAIEKAVPRSLVEEVLEQYQCKEKRVRKLSMEIIVYLLIGMNLFPRERLALVLGRLLVTFRWLFATEETTSPNDGTIVYRRKQLGVAPIVALFHRVCRPLATEQTQGAFLFGLRLMAIDGTSFVPACRETQDEQIPAQEVSATWSEMQTLSRSRAPYLKASVPPAAG